MRTLLFCLMILFACTTSKDGVFGYDGRTFTNKESLLRAKKYKSTNFKKPFENFVALPGSDKIFVSKYELTKGEYDVFLNDIKASLPDLYQESEIDYEAWRDPPNYTTITLAPMVRSYALKYYDLWPVVNITYQGALNYCQWATQQIKDLYGKEMIQVRLPSEDEYDSLVSHYKINVQTDTLEYQKGKDYNLNANLIYYNYNPTLDVVEPDPMLLDRYLNLALIFEFPQTENEICSLIGNASEMVSENRVYGGNWDTRVDKLDEQLPYTYPDPRIGFRIVLEVMN